MNLLYKILFVLAVGYFLTGVAYGIGKRAGVDEVRHLARQELLSCKVGNICQLRSLGATLALNNKVRLWDGLGSKSGGERCLEK